MQNLVYGQGGWLNLVLGQNRYEDFDLTPSSRDSYEQEASGDIFNAFATAAFR